MGGFPEPRVGLVVSYSYLWSEEAEQGLVEGKKDRPCAIILAIDEPPSNAAQQKQVAAEGPTRLQHDQPGCHRTASIVYVDSPATLINIRNRTATSASTITLAVQIRTSHPMRRGQEAVRTEGCSTIS